MKVCRLYFIGLRRLFLFDTLNHRALCVTLALALIEGEFNDSANSGVGTQSKNTDLPA